MLYTGSHYKYDSKSHCQTITNLQIKTKVVLYSIYHPGITVNWYYLNTKVKILMRLWITKVWIMFSVVCIHICLLKMNTLCDLLSITLFIWLFYYLWHVLSIMLNNWKLTILCERSYSWRKISCCILCI